MIMKLLHTISTKVTLQYGEVLSGLQSCVEDARHLKTCSVVEAEDVESGIGAEIADSRKDEMIVVVVVVVVGVVRLRDQGCLGARSRREK